jgi:hypothetical protein
VDRLTRAAVTLAKPSVAFICSKGFEAEAARILLAAFLYKRYPVSCAVFISPQVELALIHFIAPNSSFLGHLCGIAAGLAYVHGVPNCMLGDREYFFPACE